MSSEDKVERRDASYRLSQMGPDAQKAVPVLIKALEDRDDQIWFNAITALARIGPGAKEAVPALIEQLEQASRGRSRERAQYRTAFALGSIGPAALPELQKALEHERSNVREGAARAVTWIGPDAAPLVPVLIKCLGDDDEDVRATTAEALGAVGQDALEPVLEKLRDESAKAESQEAAAQALGWMQDPPAEATDALLRIYDKEKDASVRATLILTLDKWRCEPARFLPILTVALRSDEDRLREAGTDALILMEPPSTTSVPVLVKLLDSENQVLCERVARVLGAIGPEAKDATAPLEKLAQDQSLPEETRQVCRDALSAINP
jgi:HEAT repeat protein